MNKKISIMLSLIFIIALLVRLIPIIATGYVEPYIDQVGHTLAMNLIYKNLHGLITTEFLETPEWYMNKNLNPKNYLSKYYWFQIHPPLVYLIGGLLTPFVKDVNVGHITGAILYSIGAFTIYYLIKKITNKKSIAILAALLYALNPADIISLNKGKIIHSLGISLYPLLYAIMMNLLKKNNLRNQTIYTIIFFLILNSYLIFNAVFIISALTYLIINKKLNKIKILIPGIIISIILSAPFLIRFSKIMIISNKGIKFNINQIPSIYTIINPSLLLEEFPDDSIGVLTIETTDIITYITSFALILIIIYLILNNKESNTIKKIIPFFLGPLIFYLTQYIGVYSYPRRILFQIPSLLACASAITLFFLMKTNKLKHIYYSLIILLITINVYNSINKYNIFYNPFMNDNKYEALIWARNNISKNETLYLLNTYWDAGYDGFSNFFYLKTNFSNPDDLKSMVLNKIVNNQLLNYDYVIAHEIPDLDIEIINSVTPIMNSLNYYSIYNNSDVIIYQKF